MTRIMSTLGHPSRLAGQFRVLFRHCICLYCYKFVHSSVKQFKQSCSTRLKLTKIRATFQLLPNVVTLLLSKREGNKTELSWYLFIFNISQNNQKFNLKDKKMYTFDDTGQVGRSFFHERAMNLNFTAVLFNITVSWEKFIKRHLNHIRYWKLENFKWY